MGGAAVGAVGAVGGAAAGAVGAVGVHGTNHHVDHDVEKATEMLRKKGLLKVTAKEDGPPWYIIDPRISTNLAFWDGTTLVALIFTALITPFEVAFLPSAQDVNALFIVNRLIDTIFIFDMASA